MCLMGIIDSSDNVWLIVVFMFFYVVEWGVLFGL